MTANDDKRDERTFFNHSHFMSKYQLNLSVWSFFQDVQQMCLNKYNAIWPTSGADDGEMIKYKCAESCFSPDLFKLWLEHVREASFVAQFDYQKVCPSLEYTPEIRVSHQIN